MRRLSGWIWVLVAGSSSAALASDRSAVVHTRVVSALSGFLPSTDFLVIVKKVGIDDGVSVDSQAVGAVRPLPGLNVSVDSRGQLVKQDNTELSYRGPVDITVLLDNAVKRETLETVRKMLPEIVGSTQDEDSFKVSQAPLRQPLPKVETNPTVVVQNLPPQASGTTPTETQGDFIKAVALLLTGLGAILWLLGRQRSPSEKPHAPATRASPDTAPQVKTDFSVIPARAGAIYLLKCLSENHMGRLRTFLEGSPMSYQQEVLSLLPAWMGEWVLGQLEKATQPENTEEASTSLVARELAFVRSEIDSSETAFFDSLIRFFPINAISHSREKNIDFTSDFLSQFLALRPDLEQILTPADLEIMSTPPNAPDPRTLVEVLRALRPSPDDRGQGQRDRVRTWQRSIERLSTLEEVDSALEKAREKLDADEYRSLCRNVISRDSLTRLSQEGRASFLRQIEPDDWAWLASDRGRELSWEIDGLLRPRKLSMIRDAQSQARYRQWNDELRREASIRVLALLRGLAETIRTAPSDSIAA